MTVIDWVLAIIIVVLWNGYLMFRMKKDKNL